MAKIIIQRTSEYNNRLRDFGIYIDGKKVDTISNGQVKELTISSGRHTLFFKIDWCSSPELSFEVTDSETKLFKVGGFKNGNWIMPSAVVLIFLSFILKKTTGIDYLFYLVIPPVLLLFYYLTFGRKNYLTLKEM